MRITSRMGLRTVCVFNGNAMYHVPVLLKESIEALAIRKEGFYADLTFGGGGHARAILAQLEGGKGRLFAFDQDPDAWDNAAEMQESSNFELVKVNFRYLKRYLKLYQVDALDGIFADLGISSHQIDKQERGFSVRWDAPLDMRMQQKGELSAREVVNGYSESELKRILWQYGEVKGVGRIVQAICKERAQAPIETTGRLVDILKNIAPRGKEYKFYAQVFQAIRIETNDELGALREMLAQSVEVLKPGGRLVVLSYHSLEDRLVKHFMRSGNFQGEVEKDFYGNPIKPFNLVKTKPIVASESEVMQNSRARSAKLRIAEKI